MALNWKPEDVGSGLAFPLSLASCESFPQRVAQVLPGLVALVLVNHSLETSLSDLTQVGGTQMVTCR